MTARDELTQALGVALANAYDDDSAVSIEEPVADALLAANYRKVPDRTALRRAIWERFAVRFGEPFSPVVLEMTDDATDAILALMDGDNE
jgi:hypothetical protein